ncbi:MAG TPA: carboxypeptidase-like regulatory domain-containing protein, partial [Bradyrhizobium sp.]|nr:carboxypeptidase-like regulatory domain-containing protein [Bradyrhizobium sp.]
MALWNVTRYLAVGIATGAVLIAAQSVQAADERGSVQGVVKNASGQPVTGAFVKLKNAERRLTFMVPSQEAGHFEAKGLPVGQYT